jgi:hypothetical protein
VTEERPPERDVDEMEDRVERLEHEIDEARQDWERKRNDPNVPGAGPPADEDGSDTDTEPSGG